MDGIVSERDKLQDLYIDQLKFQGYDTNKKDEKMTTNFEPVDDEDVINKAYLDKKFKKNGHLSFIEKDYNKFKLQYNKQSVEEIIFQRVEKTTKRIPYGKGFFDNYANVDKVFEDFFYNKT